MFTSHDATDSHEGSVRMPLRLRPLRFDDEDAFRAGHHAMAAEGFTFGLGLKQTMNWSTYLTMREENRAGMNLPKDSVPSTFLVADVEGEIVGRTTIRHSLNDFPPEKVATSVLRLTSVSLTRLRDRNSPAESCHRENHRNPASTRYLRRQQHWLKNRD